MSESLSYILETTRIYTETVAEFIQTHPDANVTQPLTYIVSRLTDAIAAAEKLEHEKQKAFDAGFRAAGGLIFVDPK